MYEKQMFQQPWEHAQKLSLRCSNKTFCVISTTGPSLSMEEHSKAFEKKKIHLISTSHTPKNHQITDTIKTCTGSA